MKKYIICVLILFLLGCSNKSINSSTSSNSSTNSTSTNVDNSSNTSNSIIDNEYILLNLNRFGFDYDVYCEDGVIIEESNMKFYEIENYIIFDNYLKLNEFFTKSYILEDISTISNYNDNYFTSHKALVVYYVGSPSYVDTIFEEVKYYEGNLRFYYHSIKGEGIVTNNVIKFNFMIIDLPLSAETELTFDFIDLTEN